MVERFALIILLAAAAVAAYYLFRLVHMRRMQPDPMATSIPTLLYFRSDTCAVCPTQGRFVDEFAAGWDGRLRVQTIDAEREAELVRQFQIFTLPTTVLLYANGQVGAVNYGLTDPGKLTRQLREVTASDTPPSQLPV